MVIGVPESVSICIPASVKIPPATAPPVLDEIPAPPIDPAEIVALDTAPPLTPVLEIDTLAT